MSASLAPIEPIDAAAQCAEDAQFYRGVLHELIGLGMGFARQVCQRAQPQGPTHPSDPAPTPSADPPSVASEASVAFERISRAVRRSIALARAVAAPVPAHHTLDHTVQRRTAARARIIREVEDVIQRNSAGAEAESLHAELGDRLDAPDLDDEIGDRPVADIIADICRDLGLAALPGTHPWKRRTPEDVIALCARAAAPRRMAPANPAAAGSIRPAPCSGPSGSDPPPSPNGRAHTV